MLHFAKQRLPQSFFELDPERGPLRHEERPCARFDQHYSYRNSLLPVHVQATFLLGMAQISTGVMRAMMSGDAQTILKHV